MNAPLNPGEHDLLLVVDVQNDFCSRGALALPGGEQVVAPINRLARQFRHVVLTQDWHPRDHQSFASFIRAAARTIPCSWPTARRPCGPSIACRAATAPPCMRIWISPTPS